MTARDEAIDALCKASQFGRSWAGDMVDAIPPDVLARLAIERGGLEVIGHSAASFDPAESLLYRVVEP